MRRNHSEYFPRSHRVLKRREYLDIQSGGSTIFSEHYTLAYRQNGFDHNRLGITVTKHVGSAVVRNRTKRWIREFFRSNRNRFPCCYDLVIIPRPRIIHLDHEEAQKELETLAARFTKKTGVKRRTKGEVGGGY